MRKSNTILRGALLTLLFLMGWAACALAGNKVDVVYPYSLEQRSLHTVTGQSTMPLYIDLTSYDIPRPQEVDISLELPKGFTALDKEGWHDGKARWRLDANYGRNFDLVYLQARPGTPSGEKSLTVRLRTPEWEEERTVRFTYDATGATENVEAAHTKKKDNRKFNWYIQSVTLPVDNLGNRDQRSEEGVIYVRDTSLESFRNRMTGDGATNWSAVFNHPATFLLLDMRNPQKDIRMLKFKAQLVDKVTGEPVQGLVTAGKTNHEGGEGGWAGDTGDQWETSALISLDGKKSQTFILPLYIDYFTVLAGDYSLRVTISGNGQEKVQEVPVTIAKKRSIGLMAVGFSFLCLFAVLLQLGRIRKFIREMGARGAITVSLFAAIAFGGISLPSTILGDLVHAVLGPFSSLVTGLLTGIMSYLLIVALLVLYRKPGVLALMLLIRYMLSCVMFGHFTPLGLLSLSVNIAVLEAALRLCGFFRRKELTGRYMLGVALLLGVADAFMSFVNLQQMMFFYRLYYADWYLALYMLVNGVLYSSIGSWIGYRTGEKLRQVVGE